MILELGVIIGGCIAYQMLGGEGSKETSINKNTRKQCEEETFEYFNKLTLKEQEAYFKNNLDLKEYDYLLTDNKWFNAKHAAEVAFKKDKSFTNINKRY